MYDAEMKVYFSECLVRLDCFSPITIPYLGLERLPGDHGNDKVHPSFSLSLSLPILLPVTSSNNLERGVQRLMTPPESAASATSWRRDRSGGSS